MFGNPVIAFDLLGFKIKVDLSWVFVALLIAWSLAQGFFPSLYEGLPTVTYLGMGIAGVIGLFFSLVIHELSHSIVARRYGLPIQGITLFAFGGVAEMQQEPASPKAELLIAIAGPLVSLALAVAFHGAAAAGQASGVSEPIVAVSRYLGLLNLVLAVFNMVPAFPLDGGRVLRAVLWQRKGNLQQATHTASRIGAGIALVLIGLGVVNALSGNLVGGIWWVLIGLFLRAAATGSYYQLIARRALEGEPVRRFMTDQPVAVPSTATIREFLDDYAYKHSFEFFPVMDEGELRGCLSTRQIKEVPRELWEQRTVGQIASNCTPDNTIAAEADAATALAQMQRTGNSRLLVVENGRLVGVVVLKDMLNLLALKIELGDQPLSDANPRWR
ncbi:MAG: CBS domain-containing protein [Alphaproteobacteria bacterium]|nr:CBS domain-containing protein [Alphaproteobacteria bacterium]